MNPGLFVAKKKPVMIIMTRHKNTKAAKKTVTRRKRLAVDPLFVDAESIPNMIMGIKRMPTTKHAVPYEIHLVDETLPPRFKPAGHPSFDASNHMPTIMRTAAEMDSRVAIIIQTASRPPAMELDGCLPLSGSKEARECELVGGCEVCLCELDTDLYLEEDL